MERKITITYIVGGIIGLILLYIIAVGLISSPSSKPYTPGQLPANATDAQRAEVIAKGVTAALDDQLTSFFGFLPNDLITPWFIDNTTSYQLGVVYATRPASDIMSEEVGRYGSRDTIDPRLADATSRFFSYSEYAWGFWFIYDAENKYKAGINNWASWAQNVGKPGKLGSVYNMKSDVAYNIIKYCLTMTDYALGILNNTKIGHFETDNDIYYAKGVLAVTGNIFRALIAVDPSVVDRGGKENVMEALERFKLIEEFNPIYTMAGGNEVGDAMLPNHVAALARHIDVVNSQLDDMLKGLAR